MATSISTGSFAVDTGDLKKLAADLRAVSPAASRGTSKRMKAAAMIVATEAKARSSFSRRIPGSIRPSVTAVFKAKVVAGGAKAPDAAPIENNGKGFVRHPVFGNMDVWTAQGSHPAYLAPALDAKVEELADAISEVIDDALHETGWKGD